MTQTEQTEQPKQTTKRIRTRKPPSEAVVLARALDRNAAALAKIKPELFFSPKVQMLRDNTGSYDQSATLLDGKELLSVKFVPAEQVGALPALHARWQKQDTVQSPSREEAEALKEAGFIVEDYDDDTGPWCYFREKKISHTWVICTQEGWKLTKAKSARTAPRDAWNTLTISDPEHRIVPSLPGCPHNYRTVLRDSLIEAKVKLQMKLPTRVTSLPAFDQVMLDLWESAVETVEEHSNELELLIASN